MAVPAGQRQAERRRKLALIVKRIFDDSDGTSGYRRAAHQLLRPGTVAGPELVRSLMRRAGPGAPPAVALAPVDPAARAGRADPDLVHRDFTADMPGPKMVGDITYIPTWQGWLYLASVIDCALAGVIGWATGDNYKTPLIEEAIRDGGPQSTLLPMVRFSTPTAAATTPPRSSPGRWRGTVIRHSVGRTGYLLR